MENGLRQAMERRAARIENLRSEIASLPAGAFGGAATFEIGCGKGHYLSAYGQAHPGEMCVGIDLISARVRDGERRSGMRGNRNVFFMKAECGEFLEAARGALKFSRVFIFFPDPWPKKRHHRRRLIQPDFLTDLAGACLPGAELWFRTDHAEYFEWSLGVFEAHPLWGVEPGAALPFEEVSQFQRILPVFSTMKAVLRS